MSFSDLFNSGFKKRNKGHFAAIVRVALSDGKIAPEEKSFLDKLATKLDITQEEYNEIMENPNKFPINPPVLYNNRLERLYDLSRMVFADTVLGTKQREMLIKLALGLGFTPGNAEFIVRKALSLMVLEVDLETFIFEMKNMNK